MESGILPTLLLLAAILAVSVWLLQRRGRRRHITGYPLTRRADQQRLAHMLQDDIGQKFAAARINLSALRLQLRTGGVPEAAELDAAMNLLDDGCRDLRTVSRLMATNEKIEVNEALGIAEEQK